MALMSGNSEGVTDTHPGLEPLPVVDIYQSSGVYAVLDEGCNSTVHGTEWISNAAKKLSNLGYIVPGSRPMLPKPLRVLAEKLRP